MHEIDKPIPFVLPPEGWPQTTTCNPSQKNSKHFPCVSELPRRYRETGSIDIITESPELTSTTKDPGPETKKAQGPVQLSPIRLPENRILDTSIDSDIVQELAETLDNSRDLFESPEPLEDVPPLDDSVKIPVIASSKVESDEMKNNVHDVVEGIIDDIVKKACYLHECQTLGYRVLSMLDYSKADALSNFKDTFNISSDMNDTADEIRKCNSDGTIDIIEIEDAADNDKAKKSTWNISQDVRKMIKLAREKGLHGIKLVEDLFDSGDEKNESFKRARNEIEIVETLYESGDSFGEIEIISTSRRLPKHVVLVENLNEKDSGSNDHIKRAEVAKPSKTPQRKLIFVDSLYEPGDSDLDSGDGTNVEPLKPVFNSQDSFQLNVSMDVDLEQEDYSWDFNNLTTIEHGEDESMEPSMVSWENSIEVINNFDQSRDADISALSDTTAGDSDSDFDRTWITVYR